MTQTGKAFLGLSEGETQLPYIEVAKDIGAFKEACAIDIIDVRTEGKPL